MVTQECSARSRSFTGLLCVCSTRYAGALTVTDASMPTSLNNEDLARLSLDEAGFGNAELVSTVRDSTAFGDAWAVFCIDTVLLRFTRDRGQVFVDLATPSAPETFHQIDDVGIAMRWWSVAEVLARSEPEPIGAVLRRLKANFGGVCEAFSGDRERLTRARVERAARERGEAFKARLRGKR